MITRGKLLHVKKPSRHIPCDGEIIMIIYGRVLLEPLSRPPQTESEVKVKKHLDSHLNEKTYI